MASLIWAPIEDAPIAQGFWYGGVAYLDPVMIEGLTSTGLIVDAFYWAKGDYVDRWMDVTGQIEYDLTHYRLVEVPDWIR